jgi:hypothetical protein
LSVVIGLGLTEVLTGGASLIKVRDEVRFYWIHVEGTFRQPLIFGQPILHPSEISGIPMVALCVVLALSKSR